MQRPFSGPRYVQDIFVNFLVGKIGIIASIIISKTKTNLIHMIPDFVNIVTYSSVMIEALAGCHPARCM